MDIEFTGEEFTIDRGHFAVARVVGEKDLETLPSLVGREVVLFRPGRALSGKKRIVAAENYSTSADGEWKICLLLEDRELQSS